MAKTVAPVHNEEETKEAVNSISKEKLLELMCIDKPARTSTKERNDVTIK